MICAAQLGLRWLGAGGDGDGGGGEGGGGGGVETDGAEQTDCPKLVSTLPMLAVFSTFHQLEFSTGGWLTSDSYVNVLSVMAPSPPLPEPGSELSTPLKWSRPVPLLPSKNSRPKPASGVRANQIISETREALC